METNIAQAVEITYDRARYDESVKELLADKQILARILKYTLEEFKETDIKTIIDNIDEPEVSRIRLEPGHTNTDRIKKCSEEDIILGEGKIFFDIRFSAYCGDELIKVLINIEAQKSSKVSKLGYHLDNRIIYYLGRMISSQKEVEFTKSDYDKLKAVRSIWICMDAGDDEDSIIRMNLAQENIFGSGMNLPNIDKVQGVIIRLRNNENSEESKNILIAMLEELLRKEAADVKKRRLSEEYGIEMTRDTEKKVNVMCNLSEVVLEKGKGIGELTGKVVARFEDGLPIEEIANKSHVSVEVVKEILREKGML